MNQTPWKPESHLNALQTPAHKGGAAQRKLYRQEELDAAVAAERERCARECDDEAETIKYDDDGAVYGARQCARRIRGA